MTTVQRATRSVRPASAIASAALSVLITGGCIVQDQLTTLIIHPDGKAELVAYQTNIHSNESGEKAARELREYAKRFDAREEGDLKRAVAAGGEVVEARWVRREPPYASFYRVHLPSADALVRFCTIPGEDDGPVVEAEFTADKRVRRLSLLIASPEPPPDGKPEKTDSRESLHGELANGVNLTRVVLAGGRVRSCEGFTVAADGRSALLDQDAIERLLTVGAGTATLHIEWELPEQTTTPAE